MEYEKWSNTDAAQKQKLERLFQKTGKLSLNDWMVAIESWGMPPDTISEITGVA